jgi:hypothetical protein
MIGTVLVALGVLGAVIGWDRQLPARDESWSRITAKRKVFTALGIPVGLAVAFLGSRLVAAGWSPDGFYETLTVLTMAIVASGGLALAALTAVKLLRSSP